MREPRGQQYRQGPGKPAPLQQGAFWNALAASLALLTSTWMCRYDLVLLPLTMSSATDLRSKISHRERGEKKHGRDPNFNEMLDRLH